MFLRFLPWNRRLLKLIGIPRSCWNSWTPTASATYRWHSQLLEWTSVNVLTGSLNSCVIISTPRTIRNAVTVPNLQPFLNLSNLNYSVNLQQNCFIFLKAMYPSTLLLDAHFFKKVQHVWNNGAIVKGNTKKHTNTFNEKKKCHLEI